jgi:hypothetical protein
MLAVSWSSGNLASAAVDYISGWLILTDVSYL